MKTRILLLTLLSAILSYTLYTKLKAEQPPTPPEYSKPKALQNEKNMALTDSFYLQPKYFIALYKHILVKGRLETVNASSMIGKTMNVNYRILSYGNWTMTVDVWKVNLDEVQSNRIYFSMINPKHENYGNVLMTNSSTVTIECQDSTNQEQIRNAYNDIINTLPSHD